MSTRRHSQPKQEPALTPELAEIKQILEVMQMLKGLGKSAQSPAPSAEIREGADWAVQVVDALLKRVIRRVPKGGSKTRAPEHCPYTGLNRSQIYELMKRRKHGRPLIKTVALREPDETQGARFYYVGSVLDYLNELAEAQASQSPDDVPKKRRNKKANGKHTETSPE
jgi:hypothetical protein